MELQVGRTVIYHAAGGTLPPDPQRMIEPSLKHLPTSASLIGRIKIHDPAAWERFAAIYAPIVYGWIRNARLQENDAADLVQEVFQAVASGIDQFGAPGKPTRFRAWLRGITRHKLQDFFRRATSQPQAVGGSDAYYQISQLPDLLPDSTESNAWEVTMLAQRALQLIKTDFHETTWQAFYLVTVELQPAAEVASQLGISLGAVYTAKSRVLAHLRRELEGLD